jgi:hypothetical protein
MLSICGSTYRNPNVVLFVRSVLEQATNPDDFEFVVAEDESGSDEVAGYFDQIRKMTKHLRVLPVPKAERIKRIQQCIDLYTREEVFPEDVMTEVRQTLARYESGQIKNLWFPPSRNFNHTIEAATGDVILQVPLDLVVHFDLSFVYKRFVEAKKTRTHLCAFFGLRMHNWKAQHALRIFDRGLHDVLKQTDPRFGPEPFAFDERWFTMSLYDDDWNLTASKAGASARAWEELFGDRLLFEMPPKDPWAPEYLYKEVRTRHRFLLDCVQKYRRRHSLERPV